MTVTAYAPRMNDQDALMWHIERNPLLRSTMVGVMILDRAPDAERFERSLENLVRAMPRFRQRAEPDRLSIAPPRWEPDPWFNLSFHVARVTAPGLGTRRDVLDLASKLAMDSFDLARPLWRLVIVDGLDEGRSALILKLHHSVTDALGFFRVLGNLVQMGPDDAISVADEVPAGSRSTPAKRVLAAVGYRVQVTGRGLAAMPGRISGAARALLDAPASALSMIASLVRSSAPSSGRRARRCEGGAGHHLDVRRAQHRGATDPGTRDRQVRGGGQALGRRASAPGQGPHSRSAGPAINNARNPG